MEWMLGVFVALPLLAVIVFVAGCYLAEVVRKTWRQR